MPFFVNYTTLAVLDLTAQSNVTALGGVINGSGETFDANGYTPGLNSNIDFLTGNSISAFLPVGWNNAGTIAFQFNPSALAVDQNQVFDPSTANSGNPMTNDDFNQSSGNTQIVSNTDLFRCLVSGSAGNELSVSRLSGGTLQTLLSVNSNNNGVSNNNSTGISSVGNSLKWAWLTWVYDGVDLIIDWWVEGIKVATFDRNNNPFQANFDEFYIGGFGGSGIGSYAIKQVQWIDGYYTREGESQINPFGDSFYQRGYPFPSGSSGPGDAPRYDAQWMIQASRRLIENNNTDTVFYNYANGGWGWSESTHSGGGTWLGDATAMREMVGTATYVVSSPSPNDITPTSSVPADLESSARSILTTMINDYPNIQGILLTNTIPWSIPTSRDTQANRDAITAVNAIYQSLANEFSKVYFFDVFTPMGGFSMDRSYCVGSGIEDAINTALGDTTNSDIDNLHLSPLGAAALASVMEAPLSTLLTRSSMTDFVIGIPPEKPSILPADFLRATGTDVSVSRTQPTANGKLYSANIPEGYELYEMGLWGSSSSAAAVDVEMAIYEALADGSVDVGADNIVESSRTTFSVIDNTTDYAANTVTLDPAIPIDAGWYGVAEILVPSSVNLEIASSTADESGAGQRGSASVSGVLDTQWTTINQATGISGVIMWARLRPVASTGSPTLTTPYSIGTNNGPLFTIKTSDTLATIEAAGFFNGNAAYASLLKTGDVLLIEASNGTKLYNVTVEPISRTITLSTGTEIT